MTATPETAEEDLKALEASDLPLTELGIARRLVATYGASIRHSPELRCWLVWDGVSWGDDITGEVTRKAKDIVDRLHGEARFDPERRSELTKAWLKFQAAARLRAVVELASTEPGVPVTVDQLDTDPWALNVANGIVDLRTSKLRPHDPAEMCTKVVPIAFDPVAACPTWERFLDDVFSGDATLIEFVQRSAGYSLTGDVREQMLIFAHGVGANGKTTMLVMLRQLAGDYGVQLDPAVLTAGVHDQHPTGLTDLRGGAPGDNDRDGSEPPTGRGARQAADGGRPDPGPADARGLLRVLAHPHHLARWKPSARHPRDRLRHLATDRVAAVRRDVRRGAPRPDPAGEARRRSRRNPCVGRAGLPRLAAGGSTGPRERVKLATAEYRTSQDHLGRFLAECCVVNPDTYVTTKELRTAYESWCEDQGERMWSAQAVGRELSDRGFDSVQKGAQRVRMWLGLGLLSEGGEQI